VTLALLAWIAFGGVLGLAGTIRPWFPLGVIGPFLVLVPGAAGSSLFGVSYTGGARFLALHPASWLILAAVAVTVLVSPTKIVRALQLLPIAAALPLAWVVASVLCQTILLRGASGMSQVVEQFVVPTAWLLLLLAAFGERPVPVSRLLRPILLVATATAVLALIQQALQRSVPFESIYNGYAWSDFYARTGFRSPGTLDHPLNAALVMLAAIPVALHSGASPVRRGGLLVLLLAGISATGSRSGIVLGLVYLVYALLAGGGRVKKNTVTALAVASVGVSAVVARTSIATYVVDRLVRGEASSKAIRTAAVRYLWTAVRDHPLAGEGVGASYEVSAGLIAGQHSFENPVVMIIVDVGLSTAVLWHVAWAATVVGQRRRSNPVALHCLSIAFVFSLGYSSYGTKSVCAILLATLCFVVLMSRLPTERIAAPPTDVSPDGRGDHVRLS
jgi:hypothetical protein